MDNQDKLLEKIKIAVQKTESEEFASMENVWQRLQDKLEKESIQKEKNNWKKGAVAASFLLVFSLGYHFFNKEEKELIVTKKIEKNTIIANKLDTKEPKANHYLLPEKEKILRKQLENVVVLKSINNDSVAQNIATTSEVVVVGYGSYKKSDTDEKASTETLKNKQKTQFQTPHFDALVVTSAYESKTNTDTIKNLKENASPLVVINDKVSKAKKYKSERDAVQDISNKYEDELESIVVLEEPIYIINGEEFSEESLFGKNPTSPYAPLNKQEIETIEILQKPEAEKKYGEKAKNGIVIIFTKNRTWIKTKK